MKRKKAGRPHDGTTKKKNPANVAGSRPRPKDRGNAQSRLGKPGGFFFFYTMVASYCDAIIRPPARAFTQKAFTPMPKATPEFGFFLFERSRLRVGPHGHAEYDDMECLAERYRRELREFACAADVELTQSQAILRNSARRFATLLA
jgi:hypothetical protein